MRRYWVYLKYVLRHKWFVFLEAKRLGILWRGITHDWSKFRPREFIPYARFFYNPDGSNRSIRSKTGYYKPTDTGDDAFDFAWFCHQKANDHHWQWWMLPYDDGTMKTIPMSDAARREMLADWRGAGRAQGTPDTLAWYKANGHKMQLHPQTRDWIEEQIGYSELTL